MLKVGQIERVEITGYSSEGMGVCRIEGCAVFVPNAIRGEVCEVKVTHVSRNSAHGKIERILLRSPHRISRACPDAKLCGGCQLHHVDYAEELAFKAQKVTDALNRIGGQTLPLLPITGADGVREAAGDGGREAAEKAFPLRGRCPSAHTGADEVVSDGVPDEAQQAAGSVGTSLACPLSPESASVSDSAVGSDPLIAPVGFDEAAGDRGPEAAEKAFPLRGRCPSVHTGADEVVSDGVPDEAQQAAGSVGTSLACPLSPESASVSDSAVGSDPLIAPVIAAGNDAAVPAAEASGDASLRRASTSEAAEASGDASLRSGLVPEAVYAYRNKAQYPIAVKNGKPVAGFYKNRTHEVVPIRRCAILPEVFDRVKDLVLSWAEEDRVSVYDEQSGRGLLRHIYVRKGAVSGQVMVCIVANGESLPREKRLVYALRREIPGLASVVLSVNRRNTNVVLGDEFRTLWGEAWIEDELCGFTFRLSPRSFYQVNHDQAQRLYARAVEFAELRGTETVLDLYCGTGTITLALSRAAGKAVGVEIVPQAIEDAKENAARNGVTNVEFFCADASVAAERLCAEGAAPDVIVVDPPRKGLAPDVIDAMVQMSPARIVYVSCDPATLARDVKLLHEKGYALTRAEAFDLFPRTFHVETVVQLVRKNPDMTVRVILNLEDADLTASEAKATYDQIKAYVQETFGLRVTSLQIAQIKRKLGLPTGEHYNLSQKENQVIPNCPPEKESAIREALRYFRMI